MREIAAVCFLMAFLCLASGAAMAGGIHAAAADGDIETVSAGVKADHKALSAPDENGWTPLHLAALNGQRPMIELLISLGASPNCRDNIGRSPLHLAAREGHYEAIRCLLDRGADVNARNKFGTTPLHEAAAMNRLDTAKLLISRGASVNAANSIFGDTPLHYAVIGGYEEMARILIRNGAKTGIRNKKGETALQIAESSGRGKMVEILRNSGPKE